MRSKLHVNYLLRSKTATHHGCKLLSRIFLPFFLHTAILLHFVSSFHVLPHFLSCKQEVRLTSTSLFSTSNRRASVSTTVTSELISQLAIIALKRRLETQSAVQCRVTANTRDMALSGKVGPVSVKGKGWESPLCLTCRVIEATVQQCQLDFTSVVRDRKLKLTVPAKGNAMIALNPTDFGNFITHPLLNPPKYTFQGSTDWIMFHKKDVTIDSSVGTVSFTGKFLDYPLILTLSRGNKASCNESINGAAVGKANVEVKISLVHTNVTKDATISALESELSHLISEYFSDLVFELDGTFLSYQDMKVLETKNAGKEQQQKQPIVMMALTILVKKFPSPGVAF